MAQRKNTQIATEGEATRVEEETQAAEGESSLYDRISKQLKEMDPSTIKEYVFVDNRPLTTRVLSFFGF